VQRRLVDEVGQVGADEAGCSRRHHGEVEIRGQLDAADVHSRDFLSALQVRTVKDGLAIEAAGPEQRGVQDLRPVGRRQDEDALLGVEAVQLREELVQGLLALVVAPDDRGDAARLPQGIQPVPRAR
jgi:hypothetical protein